MGRILKVYLTSRWLWLVAGIVLIPALMLLVRPVASSPAPDTAASDDVIAAVPASAQAQPELSETDTQLSATQSHPDETTQLVADTPSSDNCIACHTNKEKLQELAEEPEEVKSEEAEGEG